MMEGDSGGGNITDSLDVSADMKSNSMTGTINTENDSNGEDANSSENTNENEELIDEETDDVASASTEKRLNSKLVNDNDQSERTEPVSSNSEELDKSENNAEPVPSNSEETYKSENNAEPVPSISEDIDQSERNAEPVLSNSEDIDQSGNNAEPVQSDSEERVINTATVPQEIDKTDVSVEILKEIAPSIVQDTVVDMETVSSDVSDPLSQSDVPLVIDTNESNSTTANKVGESESCDISSLDPGNSEVTSRKDTPSVSAVSKVVDKPKNSQVSKSESPEVATPKRKSM